MKIRALILIACLLLAGCATTGSRDWINGVLDSALPPAFTGYAKFRHKNPWFAVRVEADGLIRGPAGWNWTWLTYQREDRFSDGELSVGRPPIPAVLPPFSPPPPVP